MSFRGARVKFEMAVMEVTLESLFPFRNHLVGLPTIHQGDCYHYFLMVLPFLYGFYIGAETLSFSVLTLPFSAGNHPESLKKLKDLA